MVHRTAHCIAAAIIVVIAMQASATERVAEKPGRTNGAVGNRSMVASAVSGSVTQQTQQTQVKKAPSKNKKAKQSRTPSKRGQSLIDRNKAAKERTMRESVHSNTSGTASR